MNLYTYLHRSVHSASSKPVHSGTGGLHDASRGCDLVGDEGFVLALRQVELYPGYRWQLVLRLMLVLTLMLVLMLILMLRTTEDFRGQWG